MEIFLNKMLIRALSFSVSFLYYTTTDGKKEEGILSEGLFLSKKI
jgi:hypothetical protein